MTKNTRTHGPGIFRTVTSWSMQAKVELILGEASICPLITFIKFEAVRFTMWNDEDRQREHSQLFVRIQVNAECSNNFIKNEMKLGSLSPFFRCSPLRIVYLPSIVSFAFVVASRCRFGCFFSLSFDSVVPGKTEHSQWTARPTHLLILMLMRLVCTFAEYQRNFYLIVDFLLAAVFFHSFFSFVRWFLLLILYFRFHYF